MKNLLKLLLFAGLVPALVLLTGCKDDPVEPTTSEFEVLTTYMAQNNLDLAASGMLGGAWVKGAGALNVNQTDYSVPDYYVIDLRSQADFDAGHIKDAHIATLANVVEEAEKAPAGKKILVVCYSGQNAARAVGALRLLGYEATALKWGMSAWNSFFAEKWNSKTADFSSPNWIEGGTPPTPAASFQTPTLNTGAADGAAILRERVRAMLQNQNWTVTRDVVLGAPENYFINNKWPLVSWDAFGHIKGAYRIDEDLKIANLAFLDPAKPLVTYCYTGQTSAITSAWLEVLGYNAKSLMFGANAIVYNRMLTSAVDNAKTKSWKGEGSGSVNNFGFYDSTGNMLMN